MKKTTLILVSLATVAVASAQDIGVTVDGRPVRFEGQQPIMVNNSVLVPLRGVFEDMGARVLWNQERQQVTAIKDEKRIRLNIGEHMADVDGHSVRMNTAPIVRNGSTLVPLRFLSEALGAQVRWNPNNEMVMIRTDAAGRAQPIRRDRDRNNDGIPDRSENLGGRREAFATLNKSTVIPVRLDTELSSNESRAGDRFTATVDSTNNGYYDNLPAGTKIEGRVVTATRRNGNDPGILELAFDRIILPNGHSEDLDGTLVSLSAKGISKDSEGRIVANGAAARDNRGVFAGYGAGAGVIVGLLSGDNVKGLLSKGVLGGLLGVGAGEWQRQQNRNPKNVVLTRGTTFGVRLDNDLTLYR
jgi:hypothetical protein